MQLSHFLMNVNQAKLFSDIGQYDNQGHTLVLLSLDSYTNMYKKQYITFIEASAPARVVGGREVVKIKPAAQLRIMSTALADEAI